MEKASLILVTSNNYDKLMVSLKSIYQFTTFPFHLYIIDNASVDKTIGIYGAKLPHSTIVRNSENLWWGGGVNQGIRLCWSDDAAYILFLNDDIEVGPHWLENHIQALGDKSIGAVGPLNSHPRDWQCYDRVRDHFKDLKLPESVIDRKDVVTMNRMVRELKQDILKVTGMMAFFCVAFRKEVIGKIGYLDERFIMGGDDDDYCRRLEKAGLSLALLLNTYVVHYAGSSIQRLPSEIYANMKKANVELLKQKHPEYYGKVG
jgi:O-antigen biosynthesis protein